MSINSNSNNHAVRSETILVASGNQQLANTTDVLGNGKLFDPTSFAANIANLQLGIVASGNDGTRAADDYIANTDTIAEAPVIQFVQGTPNSADMRNAEVLEAISDKVVVRSMPIDGRRAIAIAAKVAQQPTNDAWVIGGSGGAITALNSTDYALNLQFISVRNDRDFSAHGNENLNINFTTPDYTTLGTTSGLDHLIKNVVYNANLNSYALDFNNPVTRRGNKNFIALAVDQSGGGSGITLEDIEVGVAFTVAVDASGNNVQFTPDADFVNTIQEVINNSVLTNTSTVEVANLSTAGTSADADAFLIIALDHRLSVVNDDIKQVKVRLNLGFEAKDVILATNPAKVHASRPFEGEGQGRKWKLEYQKRAGLNIYTAQNRPDGKFLYITPPEYIDETIDYTALIIEHQDAYVVPGSHDGNFWHRTIILVPCTAQSEVVTMTVTADSDTVENAVITLGGEAYTVAVTDTADVNAQAAEIVANWAAADPSGDWVATNPGAPSATVVFTASDTNPKVGTNEVTTATDLTGTFVVSTEGGTCVTEAATKADVNAYLDSWLASVPIVERYSGDATAAAPLA